MAKEKRTLTGTVEDTAGQRYEGAVLRLTAEGLAASIAQSDDDGDFAFDLSDATRWPAGDYQLEVMHPRLMARDRMPVRLEAGTGPDPITVVATAVNQVSFWAGVAFMAVMLVLLGTVAWGYFELHLDPRLSSKGPPLNQDLVGMLEMAQQQAADGVKPASPAASSVSAARGVYASLEQGAAGFVDGQRKIVVDSLFGQADAAIAAEDAGQLSTVLAGLISALSERSDPFFWQHYPLQLLEVLFWAIGAMLIRLIFDAGGYLRNRRFYINAIPRHVALIVTAPILAVLIAFVLSLVDVSIGLGEAAVALDLGNVAISILVGGLIGLAPWRAWAFVQALADSFFKRLTKLVGGAGRPQAADKPAAPTPVPGANAVAVEETAEPAEEA